MDVIVQCALCESTCGRRKMHHYHELDFESTVFVKKEVVENELANKYGPSVSEYQQWAYSPSRPQEPGQHAKYVPLFDLTCIQQMVAQISSTRGPATLATWCLRRRLLL